jgi:hypothetical protein
MSQPSKPAQDAGTGWVVEAPSWAPAWAPPPPPFVPGMPVAEPGDLGPDPVLDAYAQGCFTGDLQSCDDLYNTSPPLSDYEEYAATCAGRVKPYIVMSCTQLE